eukprot:1851349-Pleurochrysis_carterae.AAC.1
MYASTRLACSSISGVGKVSALASMPMANDSPGRPHGGARGLPSAPCAQPSRSLGPVVATRACQSGADADTLTLPSSPMSMFFSAEELLRLGLQGELEALAKNAQVLVGPIRLPVSAIQQSST